MQAFKAYLKVVWRLKWEMMIYLGVLVAMAFSFGMSGSSNRAAVFEDTKTPVAWIEEGKPSALTLGLKASLAPYVEFRDVPKDDDGMQDALFHRQVEAILQVPAGFLEDFLRDGPLRLTRTTVPDSTSAYVIGARVDKYLNTARVYRDNMPGITAEALAERVGKDLMAETETVFLDGHVADSRTSKCNSFFNYISYTMFAVMILGVSSAMITFTKHEIRQRNMASPLSPRSESRQLFSGNLLLAAVMSVVMLLLGKAMFFEIVTGGVGWLLSLNVVVFSLVALSVSFFVASALKNRNAITAVANVVGLGFSFISGAFVPQSLLGSSVLFLASFTPSYWFVKANNAILGLTRFDLESLSGVFASIGIELAFAVAVFAVTQVYVKHKG